MDTPDFDQPPKDGGRWVQRTLFNDPTPNAVIQKRIQLKILEFIQTGKWSEDESAAVFNYATLLCLKLVAIWRHVDRYKKRQDELEQIARAAPQEKAGTSPVRLDTQQDLYIELDEFLVQTKSALDYLARSPALVLGEQGWSLGSFGDHGKRVIRNLRQSTPAAFRKRVTFLAHIIEVNQPWLQQVINARDRVNHYKDGGIDPSLFTVVAVRDGEEVTIMVPMWGEDQSVADMMSGIFNVLFHFVEQFFFCVLAARLPAGLGVLKMKNFPLFDERSPIHIVPEAAVRGVSGWSTVPESEWSRLTK